jgi:hypothetical protein
MMLHRNFIDLKEIQLQRAIASIAPMLLVEARNRDLPFI